MAGRALFLAMGVAAQIIGVPPGSICQAKLIPYTTNSSYPESNFFPNNATADWNSPILHLDSLQLWAFSWGGAIGPVANNPALDGLQEPSSDDVTNMQSRLYVKDLTANTTYVTRMWNGREGGISLAFRILTEPSDSPMIIEYGMYSTWFKTRAGDSPVYDSGEAQALKRGASCSWINYPRSK